VSDEEGDDNALDDEIVPDEVAGEIELHLGEDETNEGENDSEIRWRKRDNVKLSSHGTIYDEVIAEHCEMDPFEIFQLFFTADMMSFITEQTNLYATREKNDQSFHVAVAEITKFLGLLLISGYHRLPSQDDYWSVSEDLEAPIFSKVMSRERFRLIKKYLHVADNNQLLPSKVAKVLPLLNKLRQQCQQFGVFHEFLSIDESMVPYRGLHSAKQFIRNKPVRFGYKIWMMCSSNGYPYNFEIYCGKDPNRTTPLGSHVVNTMLQPITSNENHVVFFDNFFTSHRLLVELADRNIRACGTVRDNRTSKCPLMTNKAIQKKERGFYDYRSDGTVLCLKWNDNNAVSFASNYYGIVPVHNAERRVKTQGKTTVHQPHLIKMYNLGMGGVDVCDRLLSAYRPRFRSKKWWWNLFSHIINLAVVASYKFYTHANPATKMTHIQFRRYVARSLTKREHDRRRLGGPSSVPVPSSRYDGINHHLKPCNQGRCVMCQKNTRLMCEKCEKRVHRACAPQYHTK